jgi:hypothetical protein
MDDEDNGNGNKLKLFMAVLTNLGQLTQQDISCSIINDL